jgi:hypothetical protein
MHGFVNVFVAATVAWACGKVITCTENHTVRSGGTMRAPFPFRMGDCNVQYIKKLLNIVSPFQFYDDGLQEPVILPKNVIEQARQNFAISFGSCSFEEPIEDLKALNLL